MDDGTFLLAGWSVASDVLLPMVGVGGAPRWGDVGAPGPPCTAPV